MSRRASAVALVAVAVAAWLIESAWDVVPHRHLVDTPVYRDASGAFLDGRLPYRDVAFEYPPLAALLMVVARVLPLSFDAAFGLLMLIALCATVLGVLAAARALGLGERRAVVAGLVVALMPLLLGDFVMSRFDLAVAALLAWTAWAAAARRFGAMWALIAAAVALKLTPVVLVPLLVLWHRRHAGGRATLRHGAAAAAGVAATYLPFVLIAPGGVRDMFTYHLDRPLQIESLGGSYLLGLHALADIGLRVETSFGSQNLAGSGPAVIAAISLAAGLVAIVVIAVLAARPILRDPPDAAARALVGAMAATLAATVLFGKVLSPQFVVWLVPLAVLVTGRFGRLALASTVAVMLATQLYFPRQYWELVALEPGPIGLLVIRNALLVVLLAALWPRRPLAAGEGRIAPAAPTRAEVSRGARTG